MPMRLSDERLTTIPCLTPPLVPREPHEVIISPCTHIASPRLRPGRCSLPPHPRFPYALLYHDVSRSPKTYLWCRITPAYSVPVSPYAFPGVALRISPVSLTPFLPCRHTLSRRCRHTPLPPVSYASPTVPLGRSELSPRRKLHRRRSVAPVLPSATHELNFPQP